MLFNNCFLSILGRIKNTLFGIPSDTESCEDQDGSKYKAVSETMAELQVIVCLGVAKKQKDMKTKDLNYAEEGDLPCKLR